MKITNEYNTAKQHCDGLDALLAVSYKPVDCKWSVLTSPQEATKVIETRRERWGLFQSHISARARAQFHYLMSERGFVGRLILQHQHRPPQLVIQVRGFPLMVLDLLPCSLCFQVQPSGEATGNRGPKTLSGGEKSFSTICLLLSVWEAMGSPLRCLDEL